MNQVTFEPVSNRAHWIDTFEVLENGELVDLSSAIIVLSVRDKTSKRDLLNARTADGSITLGDPGQFTFTFTDQQMRGMDASKAYEVGCTITLGGIVRQYFIGGVSILDGIVP